MNNLNMGQSLTNQMMLSSQSPLPSIRTFSVRENVSSAGWMSPFLGELSSPVGTKVVKESCINP